MIGLCVLAVTVALLAAARAWAQDQEVQAGAVASDTGEMSLEVLQVGFGGRPRPGDWVSLQVRIQDHAEKVRNVMIRMDVPDADGDTAMMQRVIASNPGVKQIVWLYAYLPLSTEQGTVFNVVAREAKERETPDAQGSKYDAGRQIGSVAFRLANPVPSVCGMIGVVGAPLAGLDQYRTAFNGEDWAPLGHELTAVTSVGPADVPDRWMGLAPLEALVWTGATGSQQPGALSEAQADAIREYVMRGGHFIIVLPVVGQTWIGSPANPLADIMPLVRVERQEGVDPAPYQNLVFRGEKFHPPKQMAVSTFVPEPSAGPFDSMNIMAAPAGTGEMGGDGGPGGSTGEARGPCVVCRRLVGPGAVTVIGLDLVSLAQAGAVRSDVIWNRILGKRVPLRSLAELEDQRNKMTMLFTNRGAVRYDAPIGGAIEKTGQAAVGLLLALFVFIAYWLLAGPVGYFALKQRNARQHAWLAFVGASAVFTAIAWGGATMLRQQHSDAKHLTFIDHVYGQSNQRVRSWMSLFLPKYGQQRISLEPNGAPPSRWHQAVTSWKQAAASVSWTAFPDARGYVMDARSPDSMTVPARSTVKQVQIDWAGNTSWKMPLPDVTEGQAPSKLGNEIKVLPRSQGKVGERDWRITGSLTHGLPGPLTEVHVFVVLGQAPLPLTLEGGLAARAYVARLTDPWKPGEPLDLDSKFPTTLGPRNTAEELFASLLIKSGYLGEGGSTAFGPDSPKRLTALAFFSLLEPPRITSRSVDRAEQSLARRESTHTWEISRWFTQPCLIVIGQLVDTECPVPVYVDGQPVPSREGRTVVRWIYPLGDNPPSVSPGAPAALPAKEGPP